jgi:hypothetical protein
MEPNSRPIKLDPELIRLFNEAIELTDENARVDFVNFLFARVDKNFQVARERSRINDTDFKSELRITIAEDELPLWKFCKHGC